MYSGTQTVLGSVNEGEISYLSMMTGSEGVSFRFPQLFLSQQRLKGQKKISVKKGHHV